MTITSWFTEANKFVDTIASAVIILLIGFIIGKVFGKLIQKGLRELELNNLLKRAGIQFGLEELLSRMFEYVIYAIAIVAALNQLGMTTIVLYIVIAVILAVLAIAFLLSIKDFIPNFIAGLRVSSKRLFVVGDTITIGSVSGKVKEFGLLETKLVSKNNEVIHIPNSLLFKQEIIVKKR